MNVVAIRVFMVLALWWMPMMVSALSVRPIGEFEAKGRLSVGAGLVSAQCDAVFVGEVTEDGRVMIKSARFSGLNPACKRLEANLLPWRGEAISTEQLKLTGVQVVVKSLLLGRVCGPVTLTADWLAGASLLSLPETKLPPDCWMKGVLEVNPSFFVQR